MRKNYNALFDRIREKKSFKQTMFVIILVLGIRNTANAQVSAYSFAQSSGSFSPIAGTVLETATGNTSATSLNSNVYNVVLPFNFFFNGISYSSINVSTNGFITFGSTAPTTTNTSPISGTATYEGAIAAFGRDLSSMYDINGITGNISWETIGTAPNREVVVQWKNFRPNNSTSTTTAYSFSFQIRLSETSNVINTVYESGSYVVGNTSISGTVQIGLRGTSNSDFNNRLNATSLEFYNSTVGTANSSTQNFNTINAVPGMPPSGLTYTWTPPACSVPQGLASGSITTNTANVSWTAPSTAPSGYDIYYSTSNVPPTSTTPPIITNIAGTTATLTSLTPLTTYYVWIRSNCGSGSTSVWSLSALQLTTNCQPPLVSTTTGAAFCPGSSATLLAGSTSPTAILTWYNASTGGNIVGTGGTFTTPALTATTDYWVSAANVSADMYVGKDIPVSTTGNSTFTNYGLVFDAYSPMVIKEVDVYPMSPTNTTGTITINLKNASGTILETKTVNVNVSVAGVLNTVALNFTVPAAGNNYRLVVDGATDISNLRREISSGFSYPYTLTGICSITAASFGANPSSSYYYYLYNWKVSSICESPRSMVTATLNGNCLSTAEVERDVMKVYPNPFTDIINIDRPELVRAIHVTDASGKLIKNNLRPESVLVLDDLLQGLYILILDMKDGTKQSVKVIKK